MSRRLHLTAPVRITAGKTPRFSMTAYSGGTLNLAEFPLPVVIDLASMQQPRQETPILRDHKLDRVAGGTRKVTIGREGIQAEGFVASTADGTEVLTLAAEGFAWQCSVGVDPQDLEEVPAGKSVLVNGRTFPGPLFVARGGLLREISFVAVGADPLTEVRIAAARRLKGAAMSFDEFVKSLGLDPAGLSEDQKKQLEMAHAALFPPKGDSEPVPAKSAPANAAAEQARIAAIGQMITAALTDARGVLPGAAELQASAIAGGLDVVTVRERLTALQLHQLRASRGNGPSPIVGGNYASTPDHLAAAFMVKAGYGKLAEKHFGEQVMEQSKRLHRTSFVELCAKALEMDHRDAPHGREPMIRAALSGGSLPIALGSSADKILLASYMQAPASWRSFAATKNAPNFREQTGLRPNFLGDLQEIPEGGHFDHGSIEEETYTWRVNTYGKQLQVDRRAIVNDDLGVFGEVLPAMGRAAARALNDLVAEVILGNSGSFWATANSNYFEGAATALSATSLATAVKMLRQMTDAEGNLLDLEPRALLVPPELEVTGRELLESTELLRDGSADRMPTTNVLAKLATLAVEPRLSNSTYTGYSTTAWWLFTSPENAAVIVGFLDGKEAPTLETFGLNHDINTLSYGYRVFFDFGCALADERASIKSKGAA